MTTMESTSPPLSIVNPHFQCLPGPDLLHDLIHQTTSQGPAIVYYQSTADGPQETVSYPELHSRAEHLARSILAAVPFGSQLIIPLLLPQCPALYISQLAVLKAGGAFCPLNLDAPPERVRFLLKDVSAKVILTSRALRHKIEALDVDVAVLAVDEQQVDARQIHHEEQLPSPSPDSLAYVMYTSGSTGTPKGVGITHRAATQSLLAHDRHLPQFSRFLQFAAPTFDVSVFEIFFPLFRGATLVSVHRPALLNDLPAVLRHTKADACELTPTVAGSLLRKRENAPELKLVLTIGEMLTEAVVSELGGDENKESLLWAMYGPTEATIHCTLQPACAASSSRHGIGFPLDTVSAFVVEPLVEDGATRSSFRVLPMGEMGELAVGGLQNAVGYLNRPEQTAQAFVDTPYGRLYRTGDKARISNGKIECFGRISDGQVKLRGQRIELGEIEQAVLRSPGCRGAVAAVIGTIIVVFCEGESSQVLQTCQQWLPAFMVPGDICSMEAFPRLPSGKVDRKKLKADYEATRGEEESSDFAADDEVGRLVQEVLGRQLSVAGIDSLAAIQLASRLRQAGFDVDAVDILRSKTLANLRARIQPADDAGSPPPLNFEDPARIETTAAALGVQPHTIEAVVPCTPVQASMLAETLGNPEAYCNWIELQVPSTHTVETITSWFQQLVQDNEILRTGFTVEGGTFNQVIWRRLDPSRIVRVAHLTKRYRLEEQDLLAPLTVQILATSSCKHTSIVLQIHHALYDGWSMDLLLSDLNSLANNTKGKSTRPSFRLVANYYASSKNHARSHDAQAYWAEHLVHYQPTPMPPLLAKNVSTPQVLSAQLDLGLLLPIVQKFTTDHSISPQVLFQAALVYLWSAILGTPDDVVIGNVTAGRMLPLVGIQDIVGPCLTSIPLRARLGQVRTIRELLESIHASNRDSLPHSTLPLAEIKKAVGIAPGLSVYDVLFVYQESILSRNRRQGEEETVRQIAHEDFLETKLLVEIEPTIEETFQLRVTYHADVFHHGYMQFFLRHMESILQHIVANVDADVSTIADCFGDNLLSTYNLTPNTLQTTPDLATLFEHTVAKQPDGAALCFAHSMENLQTVSYAELNRLANKVAHRLLSSGANEAHPVAIIMEKSVLLYATILGTLKAGCAYLPLLPSTPMTRIQTILDQADVKVCVSDLVGPRFLNLTDDVLDQEPDSNPRGMRSPDPSRIANIIYTSGSTGTPKGVSVTQLNICSNLDVLARLYPIHAGQTRLLQACSQAFDVSVFEILFALTRGLTLCAATNDVLFADLERAIRVMDVTHLSMTPTVAALIRPANVPRVEFLVTSGEPMTAEVAQNWMGKLYQGYGPSETTNICSVKKMATGDHIRHLGHVLENTSALVLHPSSLSVVPIGCVGELCFGGQQVVAGYLHLPQTTADKFITHPRFGRIYRSGDMGRMLADGSLLIVGRVDDQVKLRGQRVELGEVTSAVAGLSEVVASAVTMLVGTQLVTFYVPRDVERHKFELLSAERTSNEAIFRVLRGRLPAYMVPSYLVPISSVPMTSSGKVDKAKLRKSFGALGSRALALFASHEQPMAEDDDGGWTEQERAVAAVVREVLGSSRDIGRWTPLTSLGLDSLSAIALAKSLQRTLSRQITISQVLQNSSVARLAMVQAEEQEAKDTKLDVFSRETSRQIQEQVGEDRVEAILPCTPLQEAMLASSTRDPAYLNKMLFRVHVDADAIKRYWAVMFQRHGILRTCFFSTTHNNGNHAMAQCILNEWQPEWQTLAGGDLDKAIQQHASSVPGALDSCVPPVSLAWIQHKNGLYLSFVCHHAMYDGVAIGRLLQEIETMAAGCQLPPAPSYEPFLKEMLSLAPTTDTFWRQHLGESSPQPLPRTLSPTTASGVAILTNTLPTPFSGVTTALQTLNVSLLALFQAAWSTTLHILDHRPSVIFGNVLSGRTGSVDRIDELVAPCFNTIPTCIDFHEQRRNADVLRFFQALYPQVLQHQFTPLRRIQALKGTRSLFDSLLLLQQPSRELDERLWQLLRDDGEMDVPLVCEVTPNPTMDVIEVKIHFEQSRVPHTYAEFIYDTLDYVVSTFLDYPASHITSKQSLPPTLQQRLDALNLIHASASNSETANGYLIQNGESWSSAEETVCSVLADMSRVHPDKITRHTTIFQLGLDSIHAVQVAAMLRKLHGFKAITATDIIENPTCAKLAGKWTVDWEQENKNQYDLAGFQNRVKISLDTDAVEAVLPCTPLQMGLLKEFVNSNGKDYLNFLTLRLDAGVTASACKEAWMAVVQTHPILRTGFVPVDDIDASFAMVQYEFREELVPVSSTDDLETCRSQILNDLQQPPWRVRIAGNSMHLAIHHVLYDAYSLQVILNDLSRALQGGPLPSHHHSTPAAAVHDILTQTQQGREEAQAFWQSQAPRTVINKFPVMTPLRVETESLLVQSSTLTLSFSTLETAVKAAGVTIQASAQAAWLRILSSYLGESSVVFGTILSGRTSETTREAVFPCIVTLPVVGQHSASNRELLESMMEYNVQLQRHQRASLADVQKWLGYTNTRLFDTLVVYQRFDNDHQQRPWTITDEKSTVDYPVSLEIEPQGDDSVVLRVTFFAHVLPTEQAELLLRQFDAILCDLVQHPDGKEDHLLDTHRDLFSVLPAPEPVLDSNNVSFLHEFVETSAQRQPTKTALSFVSDFERDRPICREWSYQALDEQGNRVAHHLLSAHVKTGDIVAVLFDKCPEAHFAMLGILKAGGALLALDPGAPASRKEFILQDSGAVVLLTDRTRSLQLDFDVNIPVLAIDEDVLALTSPKLVRLARPLTPQDRSYCLYTSGTTGTPKGCEITHENAVQALLAFQKLFSGHWDASSKWLQFASYHFDVSILEQYWTWSVGITLVAAPRDLILSDLAATISRLSITHIDLTPSLARLLHPSEVPSLCRGVFITGGEQLKQEILDVWGPQRVIHNFYGPTEATIGVTTYPRVPVTGRASNIGRQFANVGAFVLHAGTERPVWKGGVGELCVSGKLVGKGYLNRAELTASRFPTLARFGERVYRTGDLVRVLHDGCFDFLGRADDQVKLRGQRLELGEINHCIRTGVLDISDVATLVVRSDARDVLVSFVVVAASQQHSTTRKEIADKVLRACREKLPGYMVPTHVLLLPSIPLSPNNKAEVKQLRALFSALSPEELLMSTSATATPSSSSDMADLGQAGVQIRQALLSMVTETTDITPSTNIFELGIDSISVLRLARALQREGLPHATPALILRHPVVADLAYALSHHNETSSSNGVLEARQAVEACGHRHRGAAVAVLAGEIEYIAPCSALQQGMIARSRSEGGGAYFNVFRYALGQEVDLVKLRSAWTAVVQAHSVLRTRFVETSEGYIQVAIKDAEIAWEELEISSSSSSNLEDVLDKRRRLWVQHNNTTTARVIDRPLEFLLVNNNLLVVHIFHAIYDANSYDLMLEEVAARYHGNNKTTTIQAAPSFLDALVHGPLKIHASCKSFWLMNHLKDVQPTSLPPLSLGVPSECDLEVSRHLSFADLDKTRRRLGVTQQALVQALWAAVLQSYVNNTSASGVTFGVIVSGRSSLAIADADKVVGPLFNTVPYHHRRPEQHQTWTAAIRQCQEFHTAVLPFQHVPLRDVQKWCTGGKAIFDSLFSFQIMEARRSGSELWKEVDSGVNPDYPLAFEASLLPGDDLQVLIVAQRGFADEETLNSMLDRFEEAAEAVVQDAASFVSWESEVRAVACSTEPEAASTSTVKDVVVETCWATDEAQIMRREMALVAEVDEASIMPQTSLLELGLDSIDTIKLVARLRRAGVVLSNSELLKGQDILHWTSTLRQRQSNGQEVVHDADATEDPSVALRAHLIEAGHDLTAVQQILPPTPLQDAMISEMLASDFAVYFNHDVLELAQDVDVERLKLAWQTVVEHSPILRTAFVEVESPQFDFAHAQLVYKGSSLDFLSTVHVNSFQDIAPILDQARTKARTSHGRDNLLQVAVAQAANKRCYVVLSIAHALYDGWSLGLLHQDVEAAYHGRYAPRKPYDTHLLQTILRSSSQGDGPRDFWAHYISTATPTLFSTRKSVPATTTATTVHRAQHTLLASAATLKAFCKRHAISTHALAQASWAAVLATQCRRLDVVFGCVLSGRDSEDTQDMLFPTMNTVPVRAVLHGSGVGLLRYMQETLADVRQFQHFPLRKIQGLASSAAGGALFNSLFILQSNASGSNQQQEEEVSIPLMKSVQGQSAVEYPICVELEVVGDEQVVWRVACDDAYLSSQATTDLLTSLDKALHFFINSPEESVLAFGGDDAVSVCGLPTFRLTDSSSQQHSTSEQTAVTDDNKWSPTEETIRLVLAQMAGVEVESVAKRHSLYHLGLDSISAIKVSSALRKQNIRLSVREMIEASSIQEMARQASNHVVEESTPSRGIISPDDILSQALQDLPLADLVASAEISPADVQQILPATAMQIHMLTVSQNTHGAVFYPTFTYRLSVAPHHTHETITQAWRTLVADHPLLRTLFLATGARSTLSVPWLQITLRAAAQRDNPFVTLTTHQQAADTWLLVLRIHHALYDGVSLSALMKRFRQLLLMRGVDSRASTQTDDDVVDAGFATWKAVLAVQHTEQARAARRAFWVAYLDGATAAATPTTTVSDSTRVQLLSRAALADTTSLRALGAAHGVSLQALFLAAYATTLAQKQEDQAAAAVVFGVYLANRTATEEEENEQQQQSPLDTYPTLSLVPLRVQLQNTLVQTALAVQRDLARISAAGVVEVGLWEVHEWTGVVVDSFVNFLSLPDGHQEADEEDGDGLGCMEQVTSSTPTSDVAKLEPEPRWFERNAVRHAYPDAIDIEASLQKNGALDIGVFGSRARLDDDGAKALTQELVNSLSSI